MQEVFQTQLNMNQLDSDRIHENALITSAYIGSAGQLFLTVTNQGSVTASIARLWIINQTDNTHLNYTIPDPKVELPIPYIEPGAAISIVANASLKSGQNYAVRIVTGRGNIASYNLVPQVKARVSIYAPSSPQIGQNVTVYLGITNNDTSGNNIYNLVPTLAVNPVSSLTLLEGPNPQNISLLPNGETVYFRYVYKVIGSELPISLNGSFTNAPEGSFDNCTMYTNLVPHVKARVSIIASSSNLIGNNVTVTLCITNNDTSGNNIYNLTPILTVNPSSSLTLQEGPTPSNITLLPAGSTAFFTYVYKVTGSGLTIALNGTFANAPNGTYATTTIYATTIDTSASASIMPILDMNVFGSIPGLLQTDTGSTYWGVALANPYNRTITIYSLALISPDYYIFNIDTLTGINPTTGWSIDRDGSRYSAVFWEASVAGTPITIPAHSAYNFTFQVQMHTPSGPLRETAINVEAITTEGKFFKAFVTSVGVDYPSMNLYYTKTFSSPITNKQYVLSDIHQATRQPYNVTIYNSGTNTLTSEITFLVLVPVGWTNVTASNQTGWSYSSQVITQQNDGSWLIFVKSTSASFASGSSLVYQFSATSPSVASTTIYNIATTAYYANFSPSIASAYCGLVAQVVP